MHLPSTAFLELVGLRFLHQRHYYAPKYHSYKVNEIKTNWNQSASVCKTYQRGKIHIRNAVGPRMVVHTYNSIKRITMNSRPA